MIYDEQMLKSSMNLPLLQQSYYFFILLDYKG